MPKDPKGRRKGDASRSKRTRKSKALVPTKRTTDLQPSLFSDLPDRITIERSLSTIGFFSVHSGIPEDGRLSRTVDVVRTTKDGKIKGKATIAVHAETGGFPGVEEQDVYYAILSAVTEAMSLGEEIPSPLRFAPGELLRRMGKEPGGPNYKALAQQLKRLAGATIISDDAIYRADTDEYVSSTTDLYRVIDRVIVKGERTSNGEIAHEHSIWLSSWQMENLRKRHRFIVDYQRYLKLRTQIARLLAPYLQLWLFASRSQGKFERNYDAICQFLNIKVEQHISSIKKQLTKAMDELIAAGYLRDWSIASVPGVFSKRFKIVFFHGPLFAAELEEGDQERDLPPSEHDVLGPEEIAHYTRLLVELDIWPNEAAKLARRLTRGEWTRALRIIDFAKAKFEGGTIQNPGGFLADLLREDRKVPLDLRPSKTKLRLRDVARAGDDPTFDEEVNAQAERELEAFRAREREIDDAIRAMPPDLQHTYYQRAVDELAKYPKAETWSPELRERQHEIIFRRLVRERPKTP